MIEQQSLVPRPHIVATLAAVSQSSEVGAERKQAALVVLAMMLAAFLVLGIGFWLEKASPYTPCGKPLLWDDPRVET